MDRLIEALIEAAISCDVIADGLAPWMFNGPAMFLWVFCLYPHDALVRAIQLIVRRFSGGEELIKCALKVLPYLKPIIVTVRYPLRRLPYILQSVSARHLRMVQAARSYETVCKQRSYSLVHCVQSSLSYK